MKIENLIIRNFRRYDDATFHFHETFNVLIGNNGKGKTTISALALVNGG